MEKDVLIKEIKDNAFAKDQLLELLEDNDELMLEILETILDVSDRDLVFREKVLDKIFETSYLSRQLERERRPKENGHGSCCKSM
ncbi:hypothetical protein [Cyclobacterium marinum]|jgi:hypothetical protein|uniref:hypothetical protein n=1 Tax=Cyclobacterium marinum TaxID=104 RepID=UPI00031A9638|nr:hypothetical protein [Cyclobacterium marinum]MBI0398107.1 hypothetical protein [Cyclobacterium marinum]MBR9775229.1 hypothetical protein [Cytophagales bacterium]|tara:strand:+ start:50 stop:304 length:255 start_codon:yes stop_codon:yes gene_type:complete